MVGKKQTILRVVNQSEKDNYYYLSSVVKLYSEVY